MKNIIPYFYIIIGLSFIAKGIYALFTEQELYYLIFSLTTESKATYILFNACFGGFILYAGIRRYKSLKNQS